MKKTLYIIVGIFLVGFLFTNYLTSDNESSIISDEKENLAQPTNKTDSPNFSNTVLSIEERNEKLISAIKSTEGTLDADVRKDILTVQVLSVEPEEAQKIAEGILNQIKKYKENEHIKTVMVCDLNYKLLGYAGAKK